MVYKAHYRFRRLHYYYDYICISFWQIGIFLCMLQSQQLEIEREKLEIEKQKLELKKQKFELEKSGAEFGTCKSRACVVM